MNTGCWFAGNRSLPWEPFTWSPLRGITFIRARNPSFFFSRKAAAWNMGKGKARIKEHFRGVIAGFAVDVHAAGEVRRLGVIQPVIVGEPCVGGCDGGEFRQAFQSRGRKAGEVRFPDFFHSGGGGEQRFYFFFYGRIIDVDMGSLVIRHGKGAGGAAVQHFRTHFRFDGDPAPFPEEAVEGNAAGYVGNARIH